MNLHAADHYERRLAKLQRLRQLRAELSGLDSTRFAEYRDRSADFARDVLGDELWQKQIEILEALDRDRFVCVPSCYDSGKTFTAARAVIAHVATDPEAIALTTAPTGRQVDRLLWGEIRKAWVPELPGRLLPRSSEWEVTPGNYALGFSTIAGGSQREDAAARFQGFHGGRMLVVVDEAAGVDPAIYEAIKGITASEDVKVLLIGNPLEASGPFFTAASSAEYTTISISVFDTPNFVANKVVMPKLVTPRWQKARLDEWGEESPLYQSKVLGVFPDTGDVLIVPLSWFMRAERSRKLTKVEGDVEMGLDIARFGSDFSAIDIRQGPRVLHLERKHGADGVAVGGWALQRAAELGVKTIKGDAGGLGGPVLDHMRANRGDIRIIDVNAGGKPHKSESDGDGPGFTNIRGEMWWNYRDRFRTEEICFDKRVPKSELAILRSQSTALRYSYDARGRIVVESKEDAKKRGVPSPDLADAACLVFYSPPGPRFLGAV